MAFSGVTAYRSTSNQSIPSASATSIQFNAEVFDTDAYHSNSVNPNRITVPAGFDGYFHVTAQVYWDNADTDGVRIIYIKVNGGASAFAQAYDQAQTTDFIQKVSVTLELDAGDYVEVNVYQNSGSALDAHQGQDITFVSVDRLGS